MDVESGESTQEDDVTGVGRGESETERLGWGWRRDAGSWFWRQNELQRNEQRRI